MGAIKADDDAQALKYAANQQLIAKAKQTLQGGWNTPACTTAGGAGMPIGELERRNWDRIPPAYRTTPTQTTFDLTLEQNQEKAVLHMERRPDNWIVTEIEKRPQ